MISQKAYAKVNIFLKIIGKRADGYHLIASRFMIVEDLFDIVSFKKKEFSHSFCLEGEFTCKTSQNTVYKAYMALLEYTNSEKLREYFYEHKVVVEKNIPAFAGLGGGSSDAATFLKMCNETLSLGLSIKELAQVGEKVGADVPFFVYGYKSANVTGVGEIVEKFDEKSLHVNTFTPCIEISTPAVYKEYSQNFYAPLSKEKIAIILQTPSSEILQKFIREEANDLYLPAKKLYPSLVEYERDGWFFSGSGSSFFKTKD